MSQENITFIENQFHSIVFFDKTLAQCERVNVLGPAFETFKVDDSDSDGYTTKAQTERFVLVGQAINFHLIQTLCQQFFASQTVVNIRPHKLHNKWSRQAIVIEIEPKDEHQLSSQFLNTIADKFFVDCFKIAQVKLEQAGLLVMDMDSTIIDMECIDEIAALVGVGEKVSALTERAMQGELDFNQSLLARVGCLEGVTEDELNVLKYRLPINPGFASTIEVLHQMGWKTCIASGGFTYFANHLKDCFNLSEAFSNTLEIQDAKLTGKVLGDILNAETKRDIVLKQSQKYGIPLNQTVAIGDGANDLLMMDKAALGVAYKAKPKVKQQADSCINYCGFEGLLYCLDAD